MAEMEDLKSAQSQPGYGDSSLRSDASADAEPSAADELWDSEQERREAEWTAMHGSWWRLR